MKRSPIRLAVLVVAVLGLIGWQLLNLREPAYQGKPLTYWLDQYGTNHWSRPNGPLDKQDETAIRHFGANAVPVLFRLITSRESRLKLKWFAIVPNRWLARFHLRSDMEYRAELGRCRRLGAYGFIALGPEAKPAVPALIALLNDPYPDERYLAVFTLRCLGPVARDALPSVIRCLDDPEFTVRDDAVMALGTIQAEPERVIPILIGCLEKFHTNSILCRDAIDALSQFGPQAKPAVPKVLPLLNDSDEYIRSAVTNALRVIDPAAAVRAARSVQLKVQGDEKPHQ